MNLKYYIYSAALFSLATVGAFAEEPLADVSEMVAVSEPETKSSCPLHPKDQFFRSSTAVSVGVNSLSVHAAGLTEVHMDSVVHEATGPVVSVKQELSLSNFFLRLKGSGTWSMTTQIPGLITYDQPEVTLYTRSYHSTMTAFTTGGELGYEFFMLNGFMSIKPYAGFSARWYKGRIRGFGDNDSGTPSTATHHPGHVIYKVRLFAPGAGLGFVFYPKTQTILEFQLGFEMPSGFTQVANVRGSIFSLDVKNRLDQSRHALTASVCATQKLAKYLSGRAAVDFYSAAATGSYTGAGIDEEHLDRAEGRAQSLAFSLGLDLVF